MEEQHQQQQGNDDDLQMMMTRTCLVLPEDMIAHQILRRLPPRDLAVCRCVCAEWKAAVDGQRLLRRDLLPLSVGGIFLNIDAPYYAEFFRPSSSSGSYSGDLTHLLNYGGTVRGHCNGLVLLGGCVANPATGWFAPMPPWPRAAVYFHQAHLVFDPAVSSHYTVLLVNYATLYDAPNYAAAAGELQLQGQAAATDYEEWPPSQYPLHVFSSATGQWEERPFLRQGDAAGPIAGVRLGTSRLPDGREDRFFAAYWKQALYVHCHNNFFLRISLSRDEYRVIKPPPGITIHSEGLVFGKSEKGPYLAQSRNYDDRCSKVWVLNESNRWVSRHSHRNNHADCCFKVWILDESDRWVLRHYNKHLGMMLPNCYLDDKKAPGPWVLEDINYNAYLKCYGELAPVEKQQPDCGRDFDEDAGFTLDNSPDDDTSLEDGSSCYIDGFCVFGFHPYKEIVFLGSGIKTAVAYDLNSSKFQYMGSIYPTDFSLCYPQSGEYITETFVYTPCKLDAYGGHPDSHLLGG